MPDRVLFCRFAKRIPAHWVEDIKTLHAFITCDQVSRDVISAVPNMQPISRWVREKTLNSRIFVSLEILRPGIFAGLPNLAAISFQNFEGDIFYSFSSRLLVACRSAPYSKRNIQVRRVNPLVVKVNRITSSQNKKTIRGGAREGSGLL